MYWARFKIRQQWLDAQFPQVNGTKSLQGTAGPDLLLDLEPGLPLPAPPHLEKAAANKQNKFSVATWATNGPGRQVSGSMHRGVCNGAQSWGL